VAASQAIVRSLASLFLGSLLLFLTPGEADAGHAIYKGRPKQTRERALKRSTSSSSGLKHPRLTRAARYGLPRLVFARQPTSETARAFDDGLATMLANLPKRGPLISKMAGERIAAAVEMIAKLEHANGQSQMDRRVVHRKGDALVATYTHSYPGSPRKTRATVTLRRIGGWQKLSVELAKDDRSGNPTAYTVLWDRPASKDRVELGRGDAVIIDVELPRGKQYTIFEQVGRDGRVTGKHGEVGARRQHYVVDAAGGTRQRF
jgi:hypothetical protein